MNVDMGYQLFCYTKLQTGEGHNQYSSQESSYTCVIRSLLRIIWQNQGKLIAIWVFIG